MARSITFRATKVPHQDKVPREKLRNLPGVYIWVSHLDPAAEALGLSREHLRRQVERQLSLAGIPILNSRELPTTPLFPCLGILVHLDQASGEPPHHLYSLEVFFVKSGNLLTEQTANSLEMVWCREAIGDVRQDQPRQPDWTTLLGSLESLVNLFIDDYQGAHEESGGPGLLN